MATKIVYIGVVILAIIAIFLGYKIYQQQMSLGKQSSTSNIIGRETPNITPTNSPQQSNVQNVPLTQIVDLESIFSQFPGPNATVGEIQKFRDYLYPLGKETGLITIRDCQANPIILRVRKSQEFEITNEDDVDHKLTIQGKDVFVNAKSTITQKAATEIGEIGYSCDTAPNQSSIGIIQTIQ